MSPWQEDRPVSDDPPLTLHHWAPSRSMIARWMLEEVGEPYRVVPVDLAKGEQYAPAHLAINPMGKVPVLVHGATIVSEVAAICCYLADRFPDAGLAPAIDDPRRGPYLKWLFFGPGCVEPAVTARAFGWTSEGKRGTIGWADYETTVRVLAEGTRKAAPYLLGAQFTAADVVVGAQIRWGLQFGTLPQDEALAAYAGRLGEREALKRQTALDAAFAAAAG